jgi:ubiquinone/menaquinone biosynthesis C-methylase UbiE
MSDAKYFYDKTVGMYDLRQKNAWTERLRISELELIKKHASGKVLDIGCGTGFHLAWLDKNMRVESTGCDVSPEALAEARKNTPCRLAECRAEQLPFSDGEFDTVLCMFSTLNLCEWEKALSEIRRIVKAGGKVILSVSSVWDNAGKSEKRIRIDRSVIRLHLFSADELRKSFENNGFRVIHFDSLFRASRPRWGDWSSKVVDDSAQPVERGAMYLYVLTK